MLAKKYEKREYVRTEIDKDGNKVHHHYHYHYHTGSKTLDEDGYVKYSSEWVLPYGPVPEHPDGEKKPRKYAKLKGVKMENKWAKGVRK